MKRTLKIEIESGDKTCASEKGKFCEWVCFSLPWCDLFHAKLEDTGFIMRCEECLKAEIK